MVTIEKATKCTLKIASKFSVPYILRKICFCLSMAYCIFGSQEPLDRLIAARPSVLIWVDPAIVYVVVTSSL